MNIHNSSVNIDFTTINGNKIYSTSPGSGNSGAGLYINEGSYVNAQYVEITQNISYDQGGAFFMDGNSTFNLTNVTIAYNSAVGDNNVPFGNENNGNGGAFASYGNSMINIMSSIIWSNVAANDQQMSVNNGSLMSIDSSNIEELPSAYLGNGNIDENPEFCNPSIGNFELSQSSSSLSFLQNGSSIGCHGEGCEIAYLNYALSFNGSGDYIQVGAEGSENYGSDLDIGTLLGSGPFSVSFWYYTDENPQGGDDYEFLIDQRRLDNWGDGWLVMNSGGNIRFDIQVGESSDERVSSLNTIETGTWNYIFCTYDGQTSNIYLNGNFENSTDVGLRRSNTVGMAIGSRFTHNEKYLNGIIDELSIWDRAVSEEEIQNEFISYARNGFEDGIIAHYNFDQGNGNILKDIINNDSDGIINGGAWEEDLSNLANHHYNPDQFHYYLQH